MASTQQATSRTQLTAEENAKIAEALKEAKNFHANQPNAKAASEQELAMIVGKIKNDQARPIGLLRKHAFKGKFIAEPIKTIPGYSFGAFVNLGAFKDGDLQVVVGPKAAVIYGHNDDASIDPYCGYLVAYYKPADTNVPGKVYVEAGHTERLKNMKWTEIERKLDSTNYQGHFFWDLDSGAFAFAKIEQDEKDKNLAFIGANFGFQKP